MKIAFFSDIHANLPALEAVLKDIDREKPDFVFCLGDLVGYNIWPNEVSELIRERGIPTLAGNYDQGIGLNSNDCGCAYKTDEDKANGAVSVSYTNKIVRDDVRAYLKMLPKHMSLKFEMDGQEKNLLMVHGSPRKINEYLFEDRPEKSLARIMEDAGADILLFGHTHKPYHRFIEERHAINIGSVGKPKDGDPRACYAILHLKDETFSKLEVEIKKVEYDVELAAKAIEGSPLPNVYADMLRKAY